MTAIDLAREYFPGESNRFLEDVLWSETAFPFNVDGKFDHLRGQLAKAAERRSFCVDSMRMVEDEIWAAIDAARKGGENEKT